MKATEALGRAMTLLRRLRFYEVLLVVFAAFALGAFALRQITESAIFCGNTCHVMRPYYADWKSSSHKDVPCVSCHLAPDDGHRFVPRFAALAQVASYLTRTYGRRTRAEVSDSACLQAQCHSRRLLEGKVSFRRGVTFDHSPHLQKLRRGKILRCTSCHSHIAMGSHVTVSTDVCFTCHFRDEDPSTSACRLCHRDPIEAKVGTGSVDHRSLMERSVDCRLCHGDVVQGDGRIRRGACSACHAFASPADAQSPEEVIHRRHVTDHEVDCERCHEAIRHEIPEEREAGGLDCDLCHENRHRGILLLYSGRGARGASESPSLMYRARVSCRGCHTGTEGEDRADAAYRGVTRPFLRHSCAVCHGADRDLGRAQRDLAEAQARAKDLLARAESAVGSSAPDEARRLLEEARHDILFVGASSPIHNPGYAKAVLLAASQGLERALSLSR